MPDITEDSMYIKLFDAIGIAIFRCFGQINKVCNGKMIFNKKQGGIYEIRRNRK